MDAIPNSIDVLVALHRLLALLEAGMENDPVCFEAMYLFAQVYKTDLCFQKE